MSSESAPWRQMLIQGLLTRAELSVREEFLRRMEAAGYPEIRPVHSPVFAFLPPEGSRLTDLAERAGMTKQALTPIVAELADLGLIGRRPDPLDGRAKIIVFTARGLRIARSGATIYRAMDAELSAAMGPRVYEHLRKGLAFVAFDAPWATKARG